MDRNRIATVAIALVLATGIGMAATTLESSVGTTPNDAIDLDAAGLPIGAQTLAQYDARLGAQRRQTRPGSGDGRVVERSDGDPSRTKRDDGTHGDRTRRDENANRNGERSGRRPDPGMTFLERLLALLGDLLDRLFELLSVLVAVAAVVAAVRYRDDLRALAGRFTGRFRRDAGVAIGESVAMRSVPDNDVERAWSELTALVDVGDVETATPRECAAAAVDAGADRSAVERVTETFEEVRYGHADVTDARRERAMSGLRTIRADLLEG